MTANDKASEIFSKFYSKSLKAKPSGDYALICVDEIISALIMYGEERMELQNMDSELRFWDSVKTEVKLLQQHFSQYDDISYERKLEPKIKWGFIWKTIAKTLFKIAGSQIKNIKFK